MRTRYLQYTQCICQLEAIGLLRLNFLHGTAEMIPGGGGGIFCWLSFTSKMYWIVTIQK
jgi:hypothetical protein